uniref:hypothetical protein n=1 Tax=Bacillus cytotoxicus TaxID=580165 RepID=UPI00203B1A7C
MRSLKQRERTSSVSLFVLRNGKLGVEKWRKTLGVGESVWPCIEAVSPFSATGNVKTKGTSE